MYLFNFIQTFMNYFTSKMSFFVWKVIDKLLHTVKL